MPDRNARALSPAAAYTGYFVDVLAGVATTAESGRLPAGRATAPGAAECHPGDGATAAALARTAEATETLADHVRRYARAE